MFKLNPRNLCKEDYMSLLSTGILKIKFIKKTNNEERTMFASMHDEFKKRIPTKGNAPIGDHSGVITCVDLEIYEYRRFVIDTVFWVEYLSFEDYLENVKAQLVDVA